MTCALAGVGFVPAFSQENRPNILLFIADDWSPHARVYGDTTARMPAVDYVSNHGITFNNAFCAAPTSTASRGSLLTGRYSHSLGPAGDLWSLFPKDLYTYTRALEENGYQVGYTKKGWGPGKYEDGAWADNPAGHYSDDFKKFVQLSLADGKPFCFWYGSKYPHRPYNYGSGMENGIDPRKIKVPDFLPDTWETRNDIADYYYFVERMDYELYETIGILKEYGQLSNTLIVVTGDNGMPFPRAKANLYEQGTSEPLIIMWEGHIQENTSSDELVSLVDLCPTFLEAAGIPVPESVQGQSLIPLLTEGASLNRKYIHAGRERHGYNAQPNNISYPMRSIRDGRYLLIHNLRPYLVPDDCDNGASKKVIMQDRDKEEIKPYYEMTFTVRPEWELYDLKKDPNQFNNLAGKWQYASRLKKMQKELNCWQKRTEDPRQDGKETDIFDTAPYFGKAAREQ